MLPGGTPPDEEEEAGAEREAVPVGADEDEVDVAVVVEALAEAEAPADGVRDLAAPDAGETNGTEEPEPGSHGEVVPIPCGPAT